MGREDERGREGERSIGEGGIEEEGRGGEERREKREGATIIYLLTGLRSTS